MNLSGIRTLFGDLSGRLDLVTADSNGYYKADQYIKEGSRLLDRLADVGTSDATYFGSVQAGDYYLSVPNLRSIKEVWYYTSTARGQLSKSTREQLRGWFTGPLEADNRGVPAYYLPAKLRSGSVLSKPAPADFLVQVDLVSLDITGILFPPVDTAGTFEVFGHFYSAALEKASDTNYWSNEHSMLLVWAALYHLEISYRNSEGAKDWLNAVNGTLTTIEFDAVHQGTVGLDQLKGREDE